MKSVINVANAAASISLTGYLNSSMRSYRRDTSSASASSLSSRPSLKDSAKDIDATNSSVVESFAVSFVVASCTCVMKSVYIDAASSGSIFL